MHPESKPFETLLGLIIPELTRTVEIRLYGPERKWKFWLHS